MLQVQSSWPSDAKAELVFVGHPVQPADSLVLAVPKPYFPWAQESHPAVSDVLPPAVPFPYFPSGQAEHEPEEAVYEPK